MFVRNRRGGIDELTVLVEFGVNGDDRVLRPVTLWMRYQKSVPVYVVRVGVGSQNLGCRRFEQGVQSVSIPYEVEELCDNCFSFCKSLPRVTFGESSSLKLFGEWIFHNSDSEIHIPDRVEEILIGPFASPQDAENLLLKLMTKTTRE